MKFKLSIDCGNSAFDDGDAPLEVARILRQLAERLEPRVDLPASVLLFDVNGNHVGEAVTTGKRKGA